MPTRAENKELSPKEVTKKLAEQIIAHPNAKLLVNSPTAGEWDYLVCHVFDVGYEPEIGFELEDGEPVETFWSKEEYFSEYGEDPNPDEIPEFNEYIILWCE